MGNIRKYKLLVIATLAFHLLASNRLPAQVEFLEQNWTKDQRQSYYTMSQGSRIMRYDWFVALEVSDGTEAFATKRLIELGYLPNENSPDKLPVGFVRDVNAIDSEKQYVGMNCAACHTNQMEFNGKTFQIDGAPALADMLGMLTGIEDSLQSTLDDSQKFERFKQKVLGDGASFMKTRRLKKDVEAFLQDWKTFVKNSNHPWGRGRLDAFGMIFNRVTSIDLGIPQNSRIPDAPVSYPFLWGTSFQNKVQWNGSVPNENDIERLGRNVGEVLGVFAQAEFRSFEFLDVDRPARTSAKRLNQVKMENRLKELWSPKWPEHFGKLDEAKVARGKEIYENHCLDCHAIVPRGQQQVPLEIVMTPVNEVKTDSLMAFNAVAYTVSTGQLKTLFDGRRRVPRAEMLQKLVRLSLISPYRDVAGRHSLLDKFNQNDLFEPSEIVAFLKELNIEKIVAEGLVDRLDEKLDKYYKELRKTIRMKLKEAPAAADAPDTLAYKAGPLAGIWATAPYLHNGSVPNLYELLLPADKRTKKFFVGSKKFDPKRVGFEITQVPGTTLVDTSKPGNSNSGHDMYGEFDEDERWALIEYMKSL